MEELTAASHKLAEEVYKQAAAKQQGQKPEEKAQGSSERGQKTEKEPKEKQKDEDIIDAEYKAEDDK